MSAEVNKWFLSDFWSCAILGTAKSRTGAEARKWEVAGGIIDCGELIGTGMGFEEGVVWCSGVWTIASSTPLACSTSGVAVRRRRRCMVDTTVATKAFMVSTTCTTRGWSTLFVGTSVAYMPRANDSIRKVWWSFMIVGLLLTIDFESLLIYDELRKIKNMLRVYETRTTGFNVITPWIVKISRFKDTVKFY
ncbi:hypothetical protein B0H34DRAFT_292476 [Crassisporium funariophilum]|nr:hypothetical protein B0H34DRAFT_292476 [Crassisporium funariophilum]